MKVTSILHRLMPSVPEELMLIGASHKYVDSIDQREYDKNLSTFGSRDAIYRYPKNSIDKLLAENQEIKKYAISGRSAMFLYTRRLTTVTRTECVMVYLDKEMFAPGTSRTFVWTRLKKQAALSLLATRHWNMRTIKEADIESLYEREKPETVFTGKMLLAGHLSITESMVLTCNHIAYSVEPRDSSRVIVEAMFTIEKSKRMYNVRVPGIFFPKDDFVRLQAEMRSGNPDPAALIIERKEYLNSYIAKFRQLSQWGKNIPILHMDIVPDEIYNNMAAEVARKILIKGADKCDRPF